MTASRSSEQLLQEMIDRVQSWVVGSRRSRESVIVTKGHVLKPPFSFSSKLRDSFIALTISGTNDSVTIPCNKAIISQYRKGQLDLFQMSDCGTIISGRVLASLNPAYQRILAAFPPGSRFSSEQLYAKVRTSDGDSQRHARRRWKELKYDYGFDVDYDGTHYWRGPTNAPIKDPALRPDDGLIRENFLDQLATSSIKMTGDCLPHCNRCDARVVFKNSSYQDTSFDDQGLIDHRRPVFQAGDDSEDNFQIFCQTCNNQKNSVCRACPFEFNCEKCTWAYPEKARARRLVLYLDEEASVKLRKRYGSDLERKAAELLIDAIRKQTS